MTDVHEFAQSDASFNWRIVLPVTLPLLSFDARFTLIDVNQTAPSELVYKTEKRSLDDFCRIQLARYIVSFILFDVLIQILFQFNVTPYYYFLKLVISSERRSTSPCR